MNALVLSTVILAVIDLLAYFTFADYNIKTNKLTFESKTNECKRAIYMFAGKDSFTIRSKDNVYLEAHDKKTVISSLNVYGNVHTNEFLFFQTNQWKLYYINTFDRKDNSWSPSDISTCGTSPDTFLGGPCKFGATDAYTKIANIPKHRELKIKLRVHFFDIWENDSLFLQVDNKTVWTESHQSCSSEVPIGVELEHTSDTVNILIGNTLKKKTDACTTSWGIDDFVVYYK
ncbi:hypothetical protein MKS88_002791 [Plasmodium brasilianum]|uniref:Uncharacterized protein n=1 Tax=Plasmodium brasilianum TaxID=5824 RepID=A0ACB9Y9X5_PLABR|nr:hypothetical protein MKS88_002791 [Plasmodium brasilianum]